MNQSFTLDLDTLTAMLDVDESGKPTRYIIDLEPDRSACYVMRTVFEGEQPIEEKTWLTTLETLGNDASLSPVVVWIARGMWGIPLSFGPTAELVPGDTVSL